MRTLKGPNLHYIKAQSLSIVYCLFVALDDNLSKPLSLVLIKLRF